jgi:flavin-binding protein dodecin
MCGASVDPPGGVVQRFDVMSVAKVTEITASSPTSFDDAMKVGISRAVKTLDKVTGAWIKDQEVRVDGDKVVEYRVHMKVTFVLTD